MDGVEARLDKLRERISNADFLSNKGLSNEVGLYIFAYQPNEEMVIRVFIDRLRHDLHGDGTPCRVLVCDLYDILLDICRERRLLDKIAPMEQQKGREFITKQLQRIATPEDYIRRMQKIEHHHGDVLIIKGVGRAYPYIRSHHILNNLQSVFDDIPVIMFYPGEYTGQSLTLFNEFMDDHYYRAFNIV